MELLSGWTIREAIAAANMVGEDAVHAVCGAAGLSGAAPHELRALCALGRMWVAPETVAAPSSAELASWDAERLRAMPVLWRGLCDSGRLDVWHSAAHFDRTGDELRPWAGRWHDAQHEAAMRVLGRDANGRVI